MIVGPAHFDAEQLKAFNVAYQLAERLQKHNDHSRSSLHAAVLEASSIDELIVDEAVYQFCRDQNQAAWKAGDEPAFPEVKP